MIRYVFIIARGYQGALLLLLWAAAPSLSAIPVIDSGNTDYVDLAQVAELSVQPDSASFEGAGSFVYQPAGYGLVRPMIRSGGALWLRFRLDNGDGNEPFHWVIHHQSSHLDDLSLWTRDGEGDWQRRSVSGREPFHQRQIPYHKLALAHGTPAYTSTEVLVRAGMRTEGQFVAMTHLWERSHFKERVQQEQLLHGVYYGVIFTLMLVALLFAVVLRDVSLFHYALFLLSTALLWVVHSGFAYQYLWPDHTWIHSESYHLAFLVFAITALQLAKSFLCTREFMTVLHWGLGVVQGVAVVGIVSRFGGFPWPVASLSTFFNMVILSLLPFAAWVAHYRGVERVLWFAIGWLIYALGLALASIIGIPSWFSGLVAHNYFQVVSLIQALVLSFAVVERLLHIDRDRLRAIEMAHQDPLTGLGNRRLLAQEYDVMRRRFHRDGIPVYLILFDIDHFKVINDRYGHDAGDLVIAELARLLRRFSRAGDVCVRLGGEEFALVLNADNDAVPWQIAERIRTQFAAQPTHYGDEEIVHTLSAGIAQVMSDEKEQDVRAMFASADEALYLAKAAGRNCTLFARSS